MTLKKKCIRGLLLALVVAALCVIPAFASSAGNVADAVEQTWTDAAGQIKTVVDTVVFPALSLVLGIAFLSSWRCRILTTGNMASLSGRAPPSFLSA